jgi:hypothetical protein
MKRRLLGIWLTISVLIGCGGMILGIVVLSVPSLRHVAPDAFVAAVSGLVGVACGISAMRRLS